MSSHWTKEFEVITKEHLKLPWSGHKDNFFCQFCGNNFKEGGEFRMVFTNDMPTAGGNPLICKDCFDKNGETLEASRECWRKIKEEKKLMDLRFRRHGL